jgi:HSP20 family protein
MDRKKFDISIKNGFLTIKGEKKQETKADNDDYGYCTERIYGKFSRSVRLPANVKHNGHEIKASYKDGILRIEIPKAETKSLKITAS